MKKHPVSFIPRKKGTKIFNLCVYYIYCIYHNRKPIYIGSTNNIERREKDHNRMIKKRNMVYRNIGYIPEPNELYNYCAYHNIKQVKLKVVKEGFNKIVSLKNNVFEEERYIEEDKHIQHLIKKGIKIVNVSHACNYDYEGNRLTYENKKKFLNAKIASEFDSQILVKYLYLLESKARKNYQNSYKLPNQKDLTLKDKELIDILYNFIRNGRKI